MDDVVIVGAGPAGAFAGAILARAGVKVRLFERARFPRHKLCGDTLNPGAVAVLKRHVDIAPLIASSDPIDGMILTGPGGTRVIGLYGNVLGGRSITRKVLDQWLLCEALKAGVQLEDGVAIRDVVTSDGCVCGVIAGSNGRTRTHPAKLVIAADGRRSAIAIARGLSRQPAAPRRWAIGAYFSGVAGTTRLGEMHVRRGHYVGVAPVPGGLTNACLVVPQPSRRRFGEAGYGDLSMARPDELLRHVLQSDEQLKERFADAEPVEPAVMLGPLAVDATAAGARGLLLAGDAAGFIDPMTGDGLHFAFVGAEIAAAVTRDVFDGKLSITRAHAELADRRRSAFEWKWRFNRTMRSMVASPASVSMAAATARMMPFVFQSMIRYAGDCS